MEPFNNSKPKIFGETRPMQFLALLNLHSLSHHSSVSTVTLIKNTHTWTLICYLFLDLNMYKDVL